MGEQKGAITEWIEKFLDRCAFKGHKWEIHKEIDVYDTSYGAKPDYPYMKKYVLRCEHCGDIKLRTTEV